jgi:hypothetical protein
MLSWGCLLSNPPDYDDVGTHAPVIFQHTPPGDFVSIDVESSRPITVFRAWARDEDLGGVLRFRWYLDFNDEASTCKCQYSGQAPNFGDGEYLAEFPLFNGNLTNKCNRLTVIVTDGEWLDGLGDEPGCPQVEDGANRAANDWWILPYSSDGPIGLVAAADCASLETENPLAEPPEEATP